VSISGGYLEASLAIPAAPVFLTVTLRLQTVVRSQVCTAPSLSVAVVQVLDTQAVCIL
jgi:hypothetical protein